MKLFVGDGKGDEFQELDAVLMEDNKVSEDVDRCLASPYSVSRKGKHILVVLLSSFIPFERLF